MFRSRAFSILLALASLVFGGVPSVLKRAPNTKFILYVGSRDEISAFRFDAADGAAELIGPVAKFANPSSFAIHPQNRLLYAASGVKEGTLSAYAINPKTGSLRLLNTVASRGEDPCHVLVDPNGWMILVTNCGSGSQASFRVGGDGGILESPSFIVNSDPKLPPRPQELVISPDRFYIFSPDRSLDRIFFYRFDPARVIFWPNTPAFVAMKAGSGPRRLVFRPDARYAYAANQNTSRIATLRYVKISGTLAAGDGDEVSTLPEGFGGKNYAAAIEVDAAGKFLYVSNVGDDSIAVFSIQGKSGALTKVQRIPTGGKAPLNFAIDPTGHHLLAANRDSGTINVLEIDRKTGMLSTTGKSLPVVTPSCLRFVPAE